MSTKITPYKAPEEIFEPAFIQGQIDICRKSIDMYIKQINKETNPKYIKMAEEALEKEEQKLDKFRDKYPEQFI